MEYPECSCEECQAMCKRCPCTPTAEEAIALIEAGYADRLMWTESYWGPDAILPATTKEVDESVPDRKKVIYRGGQCVFFKDGLCELHNTGLKPLEGRVALHEGNRVSERGADKIIVTSWRSHTGRKAIRMWKDAK